MSFLKSFFGGDQSAGGKTASAIDAVTYLASLASDPRAIDAFMEPLREITASLQPGQSLTSAQQIALADAYKKVQEYLITSDPLRHFEATALQEKIQQKFPKIDANEDQFWSRVLPKVSKSVA